MEFQKKKTPQAFATLVTPHTASTPKQMGPAETGWRLAAPPTPRVGTPRAHQHISTAQARLVTHQARHAQASTPPSQAQPHHQVSLGKTPHCHQKKGRVQPTPVIPALRRPRQDRSSGFQQPKIRILMGGNGIVRRPQVLDATAAIPATNPGWDDQCGWIHFRILFFFVSRTFAGTSFWLFFFFFSCLTPLPKIRRLRLAHVPAQPSSKHEDSSSPGHWARYAGYVPSQTQRKEQRQPPRRQARAGQRAVVPFPTEAPPPFLWP